MGIVGDQQRRKANEKRVATDPTLVLCEWCGGTGNELYSMYRSCPECGGTGVVASDLA